MPPNGGYFVFQSLNISHTKLLFGIFEFTEIAKTVSQVSAVCNGCVSTFSGSIFAEESKSEVGVHNGTRQCALRHILRPFFLSQLPVVCFGHLRGLFDSIFSQESKSEVGLRNRTRQCALRHINTLFSISAPCCLFWACEGSF